MQGLQQGRSETAGGSQTCSGRNVCHACDLQIALMNPCQLQRFSDNRMFDLSYCRRFLEMRILQEKTLHETAMNIDINVLVNRGGNDETPVLPVVFMLISAATTERNA